MRCYLAGPWIDKAYVGTVKALLIREGFNVVSTWTEQQDTQVASALRSHAQQDYDELLSADTFILLNTAKSAGKETEFGIALATGKRMLLIGSRQGNVFRYLPQVEVYDTVADTLEALRA